MTAEMKDEYPESAPSLDLTEVEREAERLYPNDSRDMTDTMLAENSRSAHISCARMYVDTIERLKGENDTMRRAAKIELLWELIEDWQGARDIGEDIDTPKFSYNDIEADFYDWLEKIDPSGRKEKNKPLKH